MSRNVRPDRPEPAKKQRKSVKRVWTGEEYENNFIPSPSPFSPGANASSGKKKPNLFVTTVIETHSPKLETTPMAVERAAPPPPSSPSAAPQSPRTTAEVVKADTHSQHILSSLAGLPGYGMLESAVMERLQQVWTKLDFVKDGVLSANDFASACGIDPIWHTLLNMCDLDSDGHVTSVEFIMGFLAHALTKPFELRGNGVTTGMDVMKEIQRIVNALVSEQIDLLCAEMRAQGAPGW